MAAISARNPGSQASSASSRAMYSPVDSAMPRLRAAQTPGVGLPDEPYERRADRTHDLRAAVGRTVVHDDDLLRGAGLRQDRTYGCADFQLLVVEGYDDRNGGF